MRVDIRIGIHVGVVQCEIEQLWEYDARTGGPKLVDHGRAKLVDGVEKNKNLSKKQRQHGEGEVEQQEAETECGTGM